MMSKAKILTWVVVVLVLINAITIGTILYKKRQVNEQTENIVINTSSTSNSLNGKFFRQTLGFNNEQMNAFRKANQQFRPSVMGITAGIDSLKNVMFAELNKSVSDTGKLNMLSKEIGVLHGQLKKETGHFYLSIKEVCSLQQKIVLEKAFQPLFINEDLTARAPHQRRKGAQRN
jgi:hypothetical protein